MSSRNIGILIGYNEDRRSLQDVLDASRSYSGPAPHFLWSADDRRRSRKRHVADFCFRRLSEGKLYELLQELIVENPETPTLTHDGLSLLSVALGHSPDEGRSCCSARVLMLLAVKGATRSLGRAIHHPLHVACHNPQIDARVIYRLIDLDSDVLLLPYYFASVPLHAALQFHPASSFVRKMVDSRPDALLCRNVYGQTPVERALSQPAVGHNSADLLLDLVELRPESVVPTGRRTEPVAAARDNDEQSSSLSSSTYPEDTALMRACGHFPGRHDLLAALVQAYPPALCIATRRPWRVPRRHRAAEGDGAAGRGGSARLPFEGAGEDGRRPRPPASVASETLHMALAVVEHAFWVDEGDGTAVPAEDNNDDDDDDDDDDDGGGGGGGGAQCEFRRHVNETVASFLVDVDMDGSSASGYAVARALFKLPHRMDVCRALFCPEHVCLPLRTHDAFRDAVMGRTTVIDLYRMNRMGRLDDDDDHVTSTTVAAKHVGLLELVNDNVECVYLHVRDNWVHLLPPRRPDSNAGPAG